MQKRRGNAGGKRVRRNGKTVHDAKKLTGLLDEEKKHRRLGKNFLFLGTCPLDLNASPGKGMGGGKIPGIKVYRQLGKEETGVYKCP